MSAISAHPVAVPDKAGQALAWFNAGKALGYWKKTSPHSAFIRLILLAALCGSATGAGGGWYPGLRRQLVQRPHGEADRIFSVTLVPVFLAHRKSRHRRRFIFYTRAVAQSADRGDVNFLFPHEVPMPDPSAKTSPLLYLLLGCSLTLNVVLLFSGRSGGSAGGAGAARRNGGAAIPARQRLRSSRARLPMRSRRLRCTPPVRLPQRKDG